MIQAIVGDWGERHEVIEDELVELNAPGRIRVTFRMTFTIPATAPGKATPPPRATPG